MIPLRVHGWRAGRVGLPVAFALVLGGCAGPDPVFFPSPPYELSGQVFLAGGAEAGEVDVWLTSDLPPTEPLSLFTKTTADSTGRFRFHNILGGRFVVSVVEGGDRGARHVLVPDVAVIRIDLAPAGTVSGQVAFAGTTSPPDAFVSAPFAHGAFADSAGHYEMAAPAGTWTLLASVFDSRWAPDTATVVVTSGDHVVAPTIVLTRVSPGQ